MSAIAELRTHARAATPDPDDEHEKYRLAVAAQSQLGGGALATLPTADGLRAIAARACATMGIARCSVFVADVAGEQFLGCAGYPREEIEAAVCRLKLGGPSDRLTREIVQTGSPLLIRDAHSDPRALTGAIRAWKLRSLLGVPMRCGDRTVGLMMFDNADRLHPYTPVDLEVALGFAALAASLVDRARLQAELEAQLDKVTRQNKLLRRTTVAEHRLCDAILQGAGLGAIVELIARLTGKATALYDAAGQLVAEHQPEQATVRLAPGLIGDALADPRVGALLHEALPGASVMMEPLLATAGGHRHLVAPVDIGQERWGWLVVLEQFTRLTGFDEFLVRRASTYLSVDLASRQRQVASSADGRALVARQLIRGVPVEEMAGNAEYLGIRLDAHRVAIVVSCASDGVQPEGLADALRACGCDDVLVAREPNGAVLLAEVPESDAAAISVRRIKAGLVEALARAGAPASDLAGDYSIGISGVSRAPDAIAGAVLEARQIARCVDTVPGRSPHRVLSADDLGPGRLFVASAEPAEIARFTEDVLGCLLEETESSIELLRTLEAFYDTGRSVRLASERLGVHENTVRYRLSRVHALTGLDAAADADDQLSVQVALLVLRLQGHPGVRGPQADLDSCREDWQ